jgi:hypothetical protein
VAITAPYVSSAFVCEKLLFEKDGAISAIRMVDTFYIPLDAPNDDVAALPVTLYVGIKTDVAIEGTMSIVLQTPNGARTEIPQKWPISLTPELLGANLILTLALGLKHIGWTWADVLFNDQLLTRIPMRLLRGEKPANS